MSKICLNCGSKFEEKSVLQLYCCSKCGIEYRKTHDINKNYKKITFICKNCGCKVTTKGNATNKRRVFCSKDCEKQYYKHKRGKY